MKIARVECWPLRIPYRHPEVSALVDRAGVTDVVVKVTTDDGLVGWGECTRAADAAGIADAVRAMTPIVLGRSPWERAAITQDIYVAGGWQFQPMTGNFAFAGIDMALWDLCGKAAGQPIVNLLGGPLRQSVDYFYYLNRGTPDAIAEQVRDGLARGYGVFYLKVGVDGAAEERMLEAVRATAPAAKIRIDANQAWAVPDAVHWLRRWDAAFGIDFAEAPVPIHPEALMAEVKARSGVALCVNEGLWTVPDAMRAVESRCGDYLCFSTYWVGTVARFQVICEAAAFRGWRICKHTHGEFGLAAALGQHLMLAMPAVCDGNQQTAQVMEDDILTAPVPIAEGPRWGLITGPGLGVEVDEEKVARYHDAYLRLGEYPVYGSRFERPAA